jgi:hypothetical protein
MRWTLSLSALLLSMIMATPGAAQKSSAPLFQSGDRVVLLGGAFIERLQTGNYVECEISSVFASESLTFRNLGWGGDNVAGESRAVFGSVADGYARLLRDLKLAAPTLTILHYGSTDIGTGSEGTEQFRSGLSRLVADVKATGSRVALLGTMPPVPTRSRLPISEARNKARLAFEAAIMEMAKELNCRYLTMPQLKGVAPPPSASQRRSPFAATASIDGQQLTAFGYWSIAPLLSELLGRDREARSLLINVSRDSSTANGLDAQVKLESDNRIAIELSGTHLLRPDVPRHYGSADAETDDLLVKVAGLARGQYSVALDGTIQFTASHAELSRGVGIELASERRQADQLRATIARKNEYFFHRYRPQNETYLFLFRKHEQGNNAVEIPMFDPLVEDQDRLIHQLAKPPVHQIIISLAN